MQLIELYNYLDTFSPMKGPKILSLGQFSFGISGHYIITVPTL